MTRTLRVHGVPDDVYRILVERAAARGLSLSAYVLEELELTADELPLDEWIAAARELPPIQLESSVADLIRRDRESH